MTDYMPLPTSGANCLTLGILSIVICPFLGPFAWFKSSSSLDVLNLESPDHPYEAERGLLEAGRVCGIIGTVLLVLGLSLALLSGCAATQSHSPQGYLPPPTVYVDGRPAPPEQQEYLRQQMNKPAPASGKTRP